MYMDDDTMTPRDRISDSMLRRMLDDADSDTTPRHFHETDSRLGGQQNNCRTTWGLDGYPIASVYAPLQMFRNLYDRDTALQKGTIFTELNLPFMGESVMKGGSCRG